MTERSFRVLMAGIVIFWLVLVALALGAVVNAQSASGGPDCAMAQTTADDHTAVVWVTGEQSPTTTYAGPPPKQDMFGVLTCEDGRHVEMSWYAGAPKPSFTWGQ